MAKRRKGDAPKNLGKALKEGYQPMFMTPDEVTKHFRLADIVSPYTKQDVKETMDYKLADSKHPMSFDGKTSLYESVKKEGIKEPLSVETTPHVDRPILVNGHHRLAVSQNLNPKQFVPLEWKNR